MKKLSIRYAGVLISALSLGAGSIWAQTAPDPAKAPDNETEEVLELSPFVVEAGEDQGYVATATLAGSRVRTELKDMATSISVITQQFLRDTGAHNNQTLLKYTTNTEVGGIYGNFAGIGSTYIDGAAEGATNLLRPDTNTRVRGLDSADNTRDFFATDIPWDGYNIGRVDMQRGPNSILFGIGSPAGIINASVNTAGYKTEGRVENRIGSFGSMRNSFDYNQVVIPRELAVRIAGLYDDAKYRQQPAFNRDRRLFGAVRWDPELFGKDSSARTGFRAYYEHGKVQANRPRSLPPIDRLTPFFDKDKINKQFFDASYADVAGQYPWRATATSATNFWLTGDRGAGEWANPVLYYNNNGSPLEARQGRPNGNFAIGSIAIGNFFPVGIATYNAWAGSLDQYGAQNGQSAAVLAKVAGAKNGFYKTKQITDPAIYDFYRNLLDGPNKREWQDWEAYNISFEQTFFHDRVGFQAVYDRQSYHDGQVGDLGWEPFLSVDIMENNLQYPWAYTDLVVKNQNAGRVYTSGNGGGSSRTSDRENVRFTGFADIRARDYLGDGLLGRILGHHMLTGLYSEEEYNVEDRNWARYGVSGAWSDLLGNGYTAGQTGTGGLRGGDVILSKMIYLTNSVVGFPSASQLHIPRIMEEQSPSGSLSIKYFDSHWNKPLDPAASGYVNPAAPWNNPIVLPPNDPSSTQASNPANYVGWRDTTLMVLNSDKGDINNLYKDASKIQKKITSKGLTWQAYLWDDVVVGTIGWREDTVKQRAGFPTADRTGLASMNYDLAAQAEDGIATGTNASWGIVVHTPKKFRDNLPWGTNISLGFNNGNNMRVENRYGFDGNTLPHAKGHSRDYSVVISTLDDRLTFKAAYYKTTVKDANISSVSSETSTLGNNTYILRSAEAWGTASALMNIAGMEGNFPGWEWYWNWALIKNGWDGAYNDPKGAAFLNDPETALEKAAVQSWLAQMEPQSFFDRFGYDINVAKVKAGDWAHAISGGAWQPASYLGSVQTPGAGRINGVYPTGTVDNESKGWEFELSGRPLPNWDISINASKQHASQTELGAAFSTYIEKLHAKFASPAGDLRVWWGGDNTFRKMFNDGIWAAYLFQKETNGKLVSEMSPWRFNLVTNYHFDKGLLKGVNIGGSYRWEDGKILGYALNATKDNLDVSKPYWGKSETSVDLWAGYERKVTEKIKWRVQANLGNVGKDPRLQAFNLQPDGSPGKYRIQEGMTWSITNTFSF